MESDSEGNDDATTLCQSWHSEEKAVTKEGPALQTDRLSVTQLECLKSE